MQQAGNYHDLQDPSSEIWTALFSHAAAANDVKLSCKLLQLSKAHAAATRAQLAGQLHVQLNIATPLAGQAFAAWLQRNSCLLQKLQVALTGAVASNAMKSARACRTLVAGLRSFAVRDLIYSCANTLLASCRSFAGQLTQLQLHSNHSSTPNSDATLAFAGMSQLQELVLHEANCSPGTDLDDFDFDFGGQRNTWLSRLGQTLVKLTALTRLELPMYVREPQPELLLQLPAGLQELRLGMDRGGGRAYKPIDTDEGVVEFGFPADGFLARQARQQQPLDLSHLTKLTKLWLSAVVPVLAGDKLPASLLQLHAWQCLDLQPLLGLSQLQLLAMRPSTVHGTQLLEVARQLTALQEVKLFYEGGYYLDGGCLDWGADNMKQHAAAWAQLPMTSLGMYEFSGAMLHRGEYSFELSYLGAGCMAAVALLTGLTHLALDWGISSRDIGLPHTLQQLTKLQHLTLGWDWITTYFSGDTVPDVRSYTPEELQRAALQVRSTMQTIAEGLPHLQQLHWLCDIANERLSLNLWRLKNAVQDLGDDESVTLQQVFDAVQPWLMRQALPYGRTMHIV